MSTPNTDYGCDPHEMADLLRTVAFAIDHASTAMVAFVDRRYVDAIGRDYERLQEARKRITVALGHLPPEPPMTPEREAKIGRLVAAALNKRFGDGSAEAVAAAMDDLVAPSEPAQIDGSGGVQ